MGSASQVFHKLRNCKKYNSKDIIAKIQRYDTISFDIFDTIIKRSVGSPSDIFLITAEKYNEISETRLDPDQFKKDRQAAAIDAKDKALCAKRGEITLDEIYDCLGSNYDDKRVYLKEIEVNQEIQSCHANQVIKKVYDWCVDNKKRIILTSDMYLSLKVVKEILNKCGYLNIDQIYLSSSYGKTKKSGELIKELLKAEVHKSRNGKIIHIGDNFRSDYVGFRRNGIPAILISTNPNQSSFCRTKRIEKGEEKTYRKLINIISSHYNPENKLSYQYGFECEGPLLYGFSSWLHKKLIDDGYEKVFFLARDGYLMQRVYEELYGNNTINSYYLHVSRRSVHVPLFWLYDDYKEYLLLNGENRRWNLTNLTNRLGIEKSLVQDTWKKCGLDENLTFKVKEIEGHTGLQSFFRIIDESVREKSKAEYSTLKKYLHGKNFTGRIAIVDTGGYATTQRCLIRYLQNEYHEADIKGYYLWCNIENDINYESFPVSSDIIGGETVLAELPLTAPEGSTICYAGVDENIEPVIDEYEFSNNIAEQNTINEIQRGCLEFAKMMRANGNYLTLDRVTAYHNSMMISRYPKKRDVDYFGDLVFRSDHEDVYMAKPKSILYYLEHPSKFINEIKHVKWKMGFFKRLFKIPFPYYTLVQLLKKSHSI